MKIFHINFFFKLYYKWYSIIFIGDDDMKFRKTIFLLTMFILMLEFSTYILACTGVIVGKGLTSDGSFIFGRNEEWIAR